MMNSSGKLNISANHIASTLCSAHITVYLFPRVKSIITRAGASGQTITHNHSRIPRARFIENYSPILFLAHSIYGRLHYRLHLSCNTRHAVKERKRDKERLSCTPRIDKFTHKWPGASVGAACTSVLPRNDTYIHLPTGDYLKGVKVRRFCATRSLTRRGKYIHFQPRFARKTATPSSR